MMKEQQDKLRQEYEGKLADLERERETIEEEKAQVDRYKQLLLKQRDIMIALTQRLVERDEQIMALQDELDAYDRHHKELEEKLDEKTALLIKFQRISMEVNASSPFKNEELNKALESWSKMEGSKATGATEVVNDDNNDNDSDSKNKEEILQLRADKARLELKISQLEAKNNNGSDSPSITNELKSRCETLTKEREAVHTIMEQKIKVLVESVANSVSAVLQTTPSPAGSALSKDVAALQRLVNASIAALRNAAIASQKTFDSNGAGIVRPPSPFASR
jgi:kinesin family protein 3/17